MAKGGVIEAAEGRGERPKPWHTFEAVQDGLLAGSLITKRAWEAGNLFRETYECANGSGVHAAGTNRVDGLSHEVAEHTAQAKLRVSRWRRGLAPQLFDCLESVLGCGKSSSGWARDIGEHPASGRIILVAALEQFALTL
jgi:hypothetical protein